MKYEYSTKQIKIIKRILIILFSLFLFFGCVSVSKKKDVSTLILKSDSIKKNLSSVVPSEEELKQDSLNKSLMKPIKWNINTDAILVENTAAFTKFKYDGDEYKLENAIQFTLKITNKGQVPIPTIQTARFWGGEQGGIQILINGKSAMWMSLANGAFGPPMTLAKDSTDTWEWSNQISGPNKIDYGNKFTWQWVYMKIKSPIILVDLLKKTAAKTNEHITNEKEIF